jgi:hypothetical protein
LIANNQSRRDVAPGLTQRTFAHRHGAARRKSLVAIAGISQSLDIISTIDRNYPVQDEGLDARRDRHDAPAIG